MMHQKSINHDKLWFHSKDVSNTFNADNAYNNNNFKSFDYKAKFLKQTVADTLIGGSLK